MEKRKYLERTGMKVSTRIQWMDSQKSVGIIFRYFLGPFEALGSGLVHASTILEPIRSIVFSRVVG